VKANRLWDSLTKIVKVKAGRKKKAEDSKDDAESK